MTKREEELGGGENVGGEDAESQRQSADQGGEANNDDDSIDPGGGASTASRTIFSRVWGWANEKKSTQEEDSSSVRVTDVGGVMKWSEDTAVDFDEPETEGTEFDRDDYGGNAVNTTSGDSLRESGRSSIGQKCLPEHEGNPLENVVDFAPGEDDINKLSIDEDWLLTDATFVDSVKEAGNSTGEGDAPLDMAPRENDGTTVDFSNERGDPPVEGSDTLLVRWASSRSQADTAGGGIDHRTIEICNNHELVAAVSTSDFSKIAAHDTAGRAPGEDKATTDDGSRKPGSSTAHADDVPLVKEESSNKTEDILDVEEDEMSEMEMGHKKKFVEISATDFPKKPVISITQGKAPGENEQKKIEMDASHEVIALTVSADVGHGSVADSNMNLDDCELPQGSKHGIRSSSKGSEPESAEQEDVSDDDGFKIFELMAKRTRKKRKKPMEKSKPLRISIPSHTPKEEVSTSTKINVGFGMESNSFVDKCWPIDDDILGEEDPLSFYSTTHEGQDPQYVEFHLSMTKNRLQAQLTKVQKDKKEDMKKIQTYLSAKWEENNDALQEEINKVRDEMLAKQTRQRNQLTDKHKRQIEADEQKLNEGENWLLQKQHLEMQQRMSQHAGMLEWNGIATQLQNRHAYQRQQFEERKIEMKKRSEQELNAQNQILEAHHKKRLSESQALIKELTNKCHKQQNILKVKLLRLHEERFEQKRKEAEADCGGSKSATLAQAKTRVNQSCLHTSEKIADGHQNKGGLREGAVSHDAVVRQKQRKGLMNNASIQLAIEIHNEGKSRLYFE